MSTNRSFKSLANLRSSLQEPDQEDGYASPTPAPAPEMHAVPPREPVAVFDVSVESQPQVITARTTRLGRPDKRFLRRTLKTSAVKLSVDIRAELHSEVRALLFAQNATWISLLDELLTNYVASTRSKA